MEIAILGPLEVRADGRVIPLGGPKQRSLLAMLALHANQTVSRERLIDALWGERPPSSVDQSLDTYVSRLRRVLGRDRVLHRPGGYTLRLDPGELDLDRFESLAGAAREAFASGDAVRSARLLHEALGLWRGEALCDIVYEPFANGEAERLDERRVAAFEDLFEAELALGRGAELVPELEGLVRKQPLRERLLGQLMVALYRAARHADALDALQQARHRLASELGLEPGPQLRELERRILRHDPSLDPPRSHARPRTWRGWSAVAGVAAGGVVAVVMTGGLLVGSGGTRHSPSLGTRSSGLLAIAADSGKLAGPIEIPGPPSAVAVGAGSVWVADASGQTVARVDPSSGTVTDRIPVDGEPGNIVWAGRAIWVATTVGGALKRIDPSTATVTQTVPLGNANAAAIAFAGRSLWVALAADRTLVEIDPTAGSVRRRVPLDLRPSAVAVGRHAVWIAGHDEGIVEGIDPRSGEALTTVRVGQGPSALAIDGSAVWVANSLDATVSRVRADTGAVVATIPVGSGPSAVAVAAGSIWVANAYSGTVSRIDPGENRVVETLPVGGPPTAVAASGRAVWVGTGPRDDSHLGGTLRIVTTAPFPSIDPGFHYSTALLPRLAYDTLVTFQAAAGPAGLRLVPDLALALPTPRRGGTAYVFRLRPGIRYSDGRPLRAGDFRRSIERLFRADSPGASRYGSLVGAGACTRQPARCDLSGGIVTNDKARSVTFHLRAPDPDFLYKLTVVAYSVPVPPGTPDRDAGAQAVPGTGPYRIDRSNARELRLVRNRFFKEWSHAAQPDGNPDAIVWRFASSREQALRDVEQGRADATFALIPTGRLRELRVRHPGRLRENPNFNVGFIPLNTQRPPFDDIRVRRAFNYAIDRARIARMYGGPPLATPICQPLPRGFPGYRRYCPYTVHPRPDGRWTGPDVETARRLVAASGTRGMRIHVWGVTDLPYVPRQLAAYVADVLRSLGYRTTLHRVPYAALDTPAKRRKIQLSVDGDWIPDYPAPSSFLPPFFGCHGGNNRRRYVCDQGLDRRMQRASVLELQDPESAVAAWAEIDHELVDRAYWIPTVNVGVADFVSSRVQNYQYHPVWGFLAAQAWPR